MNVTGASMDQAPPDFESDAQTIVLSTSEFLVFKIPSIFISGYW